MIKRLFSRVHIWWFGPLTALICLYALFVASYSRSQHRTLAISHDYVRIILNGEQIEISESDDEFWISGWNDLYMLTLVKNNGHIEQVLFKTKYMIGESIPSLCVSKSHLEVGPGFEILVATPGLNVVQLGSGDACYHYSQSQGGR